MYPILKNPRMPHMLLTVGLIVFIIGVVMFYVQKIPSYYVKTNGTVVSIKTENVRQPGRNNLYTMTYFPVIKFKVKGTSYQFNGSGETTYPSQSTVGQSVPVSYNPTNPSSSPRLTNDNGPVIFGSIVSALGVICCLAALILFVKLHKSTV